MAQKDFPKPVLATVDHVESGAVGDDEKAIMFIRDPSDRQVDTNKGYVMNHASWSVMEEISGSKDSDDWGGHKVVFYVDSNVTFKGKRVGGIRLRAPQQPSPENAPPPADPDPPPITDDVPF